MTMQPIGQQALTANLNKTTKAAQKKPSAVIKGDSFKKSEAKDSHLMGVKSFLGKSSQGSGPASSGVLKGFVKAGILLLGVTAVAATGGAFAGAAVIGGAVGAVVGGILGGGAGVALCAGGAKLAEKM
ncbi:MAG: hypothetical protein K8T10_09560 [Candidatus Eremiobacteraeota bacterium]|nr:hypothetical protein [Candidatus Eremiobacteraeota bacterium]